MPKRDGSATPKEMRFAYLVAQGLTQADAYARVYGNGQSVAKRQTNAGNGNRVVQRAVTKAAVAKYLEQLLPIGTMAEELIFCMRNLKGLAFNAKDERVRLMATLKLYEICERRETIELERVKTDKQRLEVISDLQSLYRKALEQPIVEVVAESAEPFTAEETAASAESESISTDVDSDISTD